MEDDDGQPKMKMHADEHGNFNGEAFIVYFMEDSVRLAESILDDADAPRRSDNEDARQAGRVWTQAR